MSGGAPGPWRALAFLLLALALVQADAAPPGQALRRFGEDRVLPLARRLQAQVQSWRASLTEELGRTKERSGREDR